MSKTTWKSGTFIYPIPAVMVSCGDMKDSNIITVAWTGIINTNPAMCYISIRPERYSYKLIEKYGEFVINLTNETLTYATDWCGVKSGQNVDKFKEMKLTKEKANFVACPMISESPVSIECKVKEIKKLGSHHMFIAEVLAINVDDDYIDQNGSFDISKCNLIAYANGGYYTLSKKIGKFGYSVQKKKHNNKTNKANSKNKKDKVNNRNEAKKTSKKANSKNTKDKVNNRNEVKKISKKAKVTKDITQKKKVSIRRNKN